MRLDVANKKLRLAAIHLTLEERGGWLSVRGIFPRKSGEGKSQQRIALGIAATSGGIDRAFARCLEIRSALACDRFRWEDYIEPDAAGDNSFSYWIEALGQEYLAKGGNPQTWAAEYIKKSFNKIPDWTATLNPELLLSIVTSIPANSRTRARVVGAFSKLLTFAGFPNTVRDYRGGYSNLKPINPGRYSPMLTCWHSGKGWGLTLGPRWPG